MTWKDGQYQPKQSRGETMKQRIVDAAMELFSAKGYHGTNAKEIARQAGVATGSFYRYFRDKKAVFMGCMRAQESRIMGGVMERARRIAQSEAPMAEQLGDLVRNSVTAHHEGRGFHREVLVLQMTDPDVAAMGRERESRVRSWLEEYFEAQREHLRVDDVQAAAALTLFAIEETAHRAVIFEFDLGEERLVEGLVDMLRSYLLGTG